MSKRERPLLAVGNETEWARLNEADEREEADSARAMSVSERLELGQKLCDQGFELMNSVQRGADETWPKDPRA